MSSDSHDNWDKYGRPEFLEQDIGERFEHRVRNEKD